LFAFASHSQTAASYKVALILPFQADKTDEQIESVIHAKDYFSAVKVRLNEAALMSLDFYQGVLLSLKEKQNASISLYVYDCYNTDSAVNVLLKNPDLKTMDVIIGPVSTSNAKLVAQFCKVNKIINIQPFTPSKSLTYDNPYHIKLAPTIDSHVDAMFQSMVDSFPGANIIIYTPNDDRSLPVANHYDSLIKNYNLTAPFKFTSSFINTKDMLVNGRKTTATEELKAGRKNIFILSSFEEPFVNGNLRAFYEAGKKFDIVLYGMPTWLNGDVIRLDYLNEFHTRVSQSFYADTSKETTLEFVSAYTTTFEVSPSESAYLGYDVSNWLIRSLTNYGKEFPDFIVTERFNGCGYKFDITKVLNGTGINYLENRNVNIYKIDNYALIKLW
jgi:ABC-type branched-subunit amino acid transport system substrate-binding protein